MRRLLLLFMAVVLTATGAKADFTDEATMKADLLQMLANFATYMQNDFQDCVEPNSVNEPCGCFRGEHTMANDERGVRPNADLSMVCAFLVKYGKNPGGSEAPEVPKDPLSPKKATIQIQFSPL